jgi:hypothetical protein
LFLFFANKYTTTRKQIHPLDFTSDSTNMGCINSKPSDVPLEEGGDIEVHDQEKRIELHFKAKRQNVFTEGLDMDHAPPPKKVVPKTDSQKELISECAYNSTYYGILTRFL